MSDLEDVLSKFRLKQSCGIAVKFNIGKARYWFMGVFKLEIGKFWRIGFLYVAQ